MATGDVRAAVAALESTLRSLRFTTLDAAAAEAGSPAPLLPALDYLLLRCSKHVALLVAQQGLQVCPRRRRCHRAAPAPPTVASNPWSLPLSSQLHGKSDLRFVEGVFKFVRDALGIRSPLTPAQFLSEVGGHCLALGLDIALMSACSLMLVTPMQSNAIKQKHVRFSPLGLNPQPTDQQPPPHAPAARIPCSAGLCGAQGSAGAEHRQGLQGAPQRGGEDGAAGSA